MLIASLVQLTELFVAKQRPELYRTLGHLSAVDHHQLRARPRVALLVIQEQLNLIQSLFFGFSSALGYPGDGVVLRLRERPDRSQLPGLFAGKPINSSQPGFSAVSFAGFGGLAG